MIDERVSGTFLIGKSSAGVSRVPEDQPPGALAGAAPAPAASVATASAAASAAASLESETTVESHAERRRDDEDVGDDTCASLEEIEASRSRRDESDSSIM